MAVKFGTFCLLLLLYNSEGVPVEIQCPDYCFCDIFEGLRRATCKQKNLVSVEIGMPSQVQILDLSYNQISQLENHIFLEIGLTNLKLLNVSHNKIAHVNLFGFEGLDQLKTLDLSINSLAYFLEQWFVSLGQLRELYLRGNQLKSISHEPRLNLPHLSVLDISRCGIVDLHPDVFEKLPELQSLDISENNLILLNVDMIKTLDKLTFLKATSNNQLACKQKSMMQLIHYTKKKDITFENSCRTDKKKQQKFQRMMMLPPQVPEKNSWLYDEEEEKTKTTDVIEVCNNITYVKSYDDIFTECLMELIELSPWIFVLFTLTFGITLGILIGCTCQLRGKPKDIPRNDMDQPLYFTYRGGSVRSISSRGLQRQISAPNPSCRPRTRSIGSRKLVREDRNILLMNESNLSDSTPVLARKYDNIL